MGLFKKEEKNNIVGSMESNTGLPMLPDLPEVDNLPELPSIQNSQRIPIQRNINSDIESIKANISAPPQKSSYELPPIEKRTMELGETQIKQYSPQPMTKAPIFIKIDKFQEAIAKFEEIKNKVEEIENIMRKIKEVKDKEEVEMIDWENDIRTIKENIKSVDSSIFSSI